MALGTLYPQQYVLPPELVMPAGLLNSSKQHEEAHDCPKMPEEFQACSNLSVLSPPPMVNMRDSMHEARV